MSMRRRKLLIIVVAGVVFSIIAASGVVFYQVEQFATALGCTPAVQEQKQSPDKTLVAVQFAMECGATTGFNTQLSITKRSDSFSPQQHQAFLVLAGRQQLNVNWKSENVLSVHLPRDARIFKQKQPKIGVHVEYE